MKADRYNTLRRETDGVETVCLKDLHADAEAELVPGIGANVFRYRVGEHDILLSPPDMNTLKEDSAYYGIPVLFPPSRIRHGIFSFGGKEYRFPHNFGRHHIHGEVRDAPWKLVETGADPERGAYALCELNVEEQAHIHAYYPHALHFMLKVSLCRGNLLLEGSIENRGKEEAPIGLGLHPYFAFKPEEADSVRIKVPAVSEYPMGEEGFFTGPLQVTEACQLVSEGLRVKEIPRDADHRVLRLAEGQRSFHMERPGPGVSMACDFSPEFGFAFLFEPPWGSAVSMEPVSSVTDAFNLPYPPEETGIRALKPQERFEYFMRIRIAPIG